MFRSSSCLLFFLMVHSEAMTRFGSGEAELGEPSNGQRSQALLPVQLGALEVVGRGEAAGMQ